MKVWGNRPETIEDAIIHKDRVYRPRQVEDSSGELDPRNLLLSLNWFTVGGRNIKSFENEGEGRDLDALAALIAQKEKERGISPENSRLSEYLPDGSENPDYTSADEVRQGNGTNMSKACHELGIMTEPVFITQHGQTAFSTSPLDQWDSAQIGFVWTSENMERGEFKKLVSDAMNMLSEYWNGSLYEIEKAKINPKTGEVLSEWEPMNMTVYGMSDFEKEVGKIIEKADKKAKAGPKA